MNFYIFNTVQVTRKSAPTEASILAEQYQDLGLPFYYYNPKLSMLLIALGIIILLSQFGFLIFGFIFPWKRKKYRCTKCGRIFRRSNNPNICKFCGGEVVPDEDVSRRN